MFRFLIALIIILVTVAVAGVMEMRKIARPLHRMSIINKRIAQGDYSATFEVVASDIPQDLGNSFNAMIQAIRTKAKNEADALEEVCSRLKDVSARVQDEEAARALDDAVSALCETASRKKESIQGPV